MGKKSAERKIFVGSLHPCLGEGGGNAGEFLYSFPLLFKKCLRLVWRGKGRLGLFFLGAMHHFA